MLIARLIAVLIFIWLLCGPGRAQNVQNTNPAVGTPLTGCVEGRALRIVNGWPSCAQTVAPTLASCGTGAVIDASATDFIGQVTVPAGITSCTIVMTKLYATTFVCFLQNQKAALTLTLGVPTVGNNGSKSTLTVPFGLSVTGAVFGYLCGPG